MGLMSEVFNSVAAREPNPVRIQKAQLAFEREQEQRSREALVQETKRRQQEAYRKHQISKRIKMGQAIRKAHDERGLPPMNRQERKTALDFAMVVNDISHVADHAIVANRTVGQHAISEFDRKMNRLIRRLRSSI